MKNQKAENEMKTRNTVTRKMSGIFDIPPGVLGHDVRIEMKGNREVLIDGCLGVALYDTGIITLDGGSAKIIITGNNLIMRSLSGDQLQIEGKISSVSFE